ncbi:MAG: aspartate kinase [Verrucomicrobiales bacterium]|jgi:aspartate kinase
MALLVQKFGGSSVADAECIQRVAQRIYDTVQEGNQVLAVVSAMGKTTDELIKLARAVHGDPSDREFDMLLSTGEQISISLLAMALHALGAEAVSMTGPQAGIFTDDSHMKAKIKEIQPERVLNELKKGRVVIVAGFQGLTAEQNIATLGRGGSDLTAVAMAAAVDADRCQIFTDVDGVYTTDPRIVASAQKLDEIAYDEMLELASMGAKVLQSRSVEFAKKYGVELEVLSSFWRKPGTVVKEEVAGMEDVVVRGIAVDKNQCKITITDVVDKPGVAAEIFQDVALADINVDVIVQSDSKQGRNDISFTANVDELNKVKAVLTACLSTIEYGEVMYDEHVAKVSIVGVGMRSHTGIAYRMFSALAENKINIHMISTSEIRVSVIIRAEKADKAVQVLHTAFGLDKKES